ncbi:TPA: AAA family ATPase [Bacillus cereus]
MENQINLKCFEIERLNNEKNVSLTFNNNLRILLGENGTGKTTILTVLYYVLSRKFYNLYNIEFSKIHLKLSTNETITLNKEWFTLEENVNAFKYYKSLEDELTKEELDCALDIVYGNGTMKQFENNYSRKLRARNVSPMRVRRYIFDLRSLLRENSSDQYNESILKVDKQIKEIFNKEILYFPTYRRIEDDLSKLGISLTDNVSEKYGVINFGMNDVQEIFDKIKTDIKDESLTSYSNVTGNMIKHLIYPNRKQHLLDYDNEIFKNKELLEIVLDRFGKDLNKEDKQYIFSLINTDEIFKDEYNSLKFYLNKLINNYMKYKKRDDSIKEFTKVCTKYLVNKKVKFNEINGEISILNLKNNKIELNHLSSGEKQIVSILAQIFLNFNDNFIILFDEPELSLSIEWQEMLLPDIIDTGKCSLLLAVTHSPFIFDNKLDNYAKGIEMFIEEINI